MIQGTVPRPARDGADERDNEPSDPGMQHTLDRDAAVGGMAPDRIRRILADLVGPLAELHRAGRAHGDISPATIGLDASGRARLLSLPVSPTANAEDAPRRDGYAAFEQYTDDPDTPCGPWTDIYALSATACALLTGQTPPPALARCVRDDYVPLTQRQGQQEYAFCAVLDNGLALDAYARPQTIGEFARALRLDAAPAPRPADEDATGREHRSTLEDSDGLEATSAWVSTQGSHVAANASFDESTGVSPDEPIDAADRHAIDAVDRDATDASRARSDHAPHRAAWETSRDTAGDPGHDMAGKARHDAASEPAHSPAREQAHGAAGDGWHGAAGKARHDMGAPGSTPSDAPAYAAQDEDIGTETPIARTRDTGKTSRTARRAMPPAGRTPARRRAPLWTMVAVIIVIAAALYMWLRPHTPQRGNVVATASDNTSRSSTSGASAGSTAGRSASSAAGASSPSMAGASASSTGSASVPATGSASAPATGSASAPSTGMASTPSPGGAPATSPSATGARQLNGAAAGSASGDQAAAGAGTQSPPAPWFTIPSDTPDSASGFSATGAASTTATPGEKTPTAASTTTPGGTPPTASSATAVPGGKAPGASSASGTPADSNAAAGTRTAASNKTPVPISVAVRPWGEILVNGRSRGVSPPLKSLSLAPGKYDITIRNNAGPDHHQTLNVTAGQSAVISHTFQ
jgi:hypothetical protein